MDPRELHVRDMMTTDVVTVGRNDTLKDAEERLGERRIRHLVVLNEDGHPCGVLSQRDLFRGVLLRALGYGGRTEERMLKSALVKEAIHVKLITTTAEATAAQAAELLVENQIGCLPVVEGDRLVGIISESDFVRLAL